MRELSPQLSAATSASEQSVVDLSSPSRPFGISVETDFNSSSASLRVSLRLNWPCLPASGGTEPALSAGMNCGALQPEMRKVDGVATVFPDHDKSVVCVV